MNLIPSLLLALPIGAQDLDQAIELIRAGRDYEALSVLKSLDSGDQRTVPLGDLLVTLGRGSD